MSLSINKDPNGKFVEYYSEAKMLTLQILLNLSFVNKAEAGARLDVVNRRIQLCKQNPAFDVLASARKVREIDANMEVIRAAYERGTPSR